MTNASPPECPTQPSEPLDYLQLYGAKLEALRGQCSNAEMKKKAGISLETYRKAKTGKQASLKTLKRIASAFNLAESDRLELKILLLKAQAEEDASRIRMEIEERSMDSKSRQSKQIREDLLDQFRSLDAKQQQFLVEIVSLCMAFGGHRIQRSVPKAIPSQPESTSTQCSSVSDDPWSTL